ncbi:MAG: hypothetical protein KDH96_11410, partial [Candidatus Riesia sp.]|nr:hypothetical protein [Candidatus Riesia sp.]
IENGYVWLGRNKIKTDKIDDLENNWERTKEIIIYTDGGDSGGMIGTTYKSITYDTDYTYKKNDFGDWEKEKEGAIKF